MYGISSSGKEALNKTVEDLFDRIALQFIGEIPRLKGKSLIISGNRNFGLPHLFVQAMANKVPNAIERDVLKSLLESSYGYIESLKNRTRVNVTERIDGLAREARIRKDKLTDEQVTAVLDEELDKARSQLEAIVEAESTKLRNLGSMMDISRVASGLGDEDPTVFFVVVRDGSTCKECLRLHLKDGVPRLWKFSELKQGYHKRNEDFPSAFGLHPHCRCTLTYLSRGFGFDKAGKMRYIEEDHDAYSTQNS